MQARNNDDEVNEWWERQRQQLLQVACSGELSNKLTELKSRQAELTELSDQYSAYTESELFLQNEYYQLQMDNIEREFLEKQLEYWKEHSLLRLIYLHPVYLN